MCLLPCCIVSPSLFPSLRRRAKELLSHLVSCRRRASMDTHSLRNSASTKRGEIYEKTFSYRVAPLKFISFREADLLKDDADNTARDATVPNDEGKSDQVSPPPTLAYSYPGSYIIARMSVRSVTPTRDLMQRVVHSKLQKLHHASGCHEGSYFAMRYLL